MPAYANEPAVGIAQAHTSVVGTATYLHAAVWFSDGGADPSPTVLNDRAAYQDDAGAAVTIRVLRRRGPGIQAVSATHIRAYDLAGTLLGTLTLTGDAGIDTNNVVDRTLYLRANPFDVASAVRDGAIELYIQMESTGGVANWQINSRNNPENAAPVGYNPITDWGRGVIRANKVPQSLGVSNVSLGGATPSKFAYPESVFHRLVLTSAGYKSDATNPRQFTFRHRNAAATSTYRQASDTQSTSATRDVTFSGLSGTGKRVDSTAPSGLTAYPAAETPVTVEVEVTPGQNFGNSTIPENAWTLNPPAGWVRVSDQIIRRAAALNVEPRLTFTRHLQLNDPVFGVAKRHAGENLPSRLESQQGNLWARVMNSRGEGINLPGNASSGQMESRFLDPFGSVRATATNSTTTQDGEAGWQANSLLFDHSLPGGSWVHEVTIRDANGVQGTTNHVVVLLAIDVQASLTAGGDGSEFGFGPGEKLYVDLTLLRADDGTRMMASSADVAIMRVTPTQGVQHYNGTAWITTGTGPVTWLPMSPHPADSLTFSRSFSEVETSTWGYHDLLVTARGNLSGSMFADQVRVEMTEKFDPVGIFK